MGNTPTFPGYIREELRRFQDADPTLIVFRKFWDVKGKPAGEERQGVSESTVSLLKEWDHVQEKNELYRVINDVHVGEC